MEFTRIPKDFLLNFKIYINSSNRAEKVCTHKQFNQELRNKIMYVVPENQFEEYVHSKNLENSGVCVLQLPQKMPSFLAPQRKWVLDNCKERYAFIMDDDLTFFYRDPKDLKLHKISDSRGLNDLIVTVAYQFKTSPEIALVGISTRLGNNNVKEIVQANTRITRCYCVDTHAHRKINAYEAPFDEFTSEDFNMNLNFLLNGYQNRNIYSFAQEDSGSNASGGCADYRTNDTQAQGAKWLKKKFPEFIELKEKKTKSSWEGFEKDEQGLSTRLDVIVQWKKAYEEGRAKNHGITRLFRG